MPSARDQLYPLAVGQEWGCGRSVEWRFTASDMRSHDPASVWARPVLRLVVDEVPSGLEKSLIVVDSINGLSAELDLSEWLFIPLGLTVTAYREMAGDWIYVDAKSAIDPTGAGMAHATLADSTGPFGVASQPLLVQRRD